MNITPEDLGIFIKKLFLSYMNKEKAPQGLRYIYGISNHIIEVRSFCHMMAIGDDQRIKATKKQIEKISNIISIDSNCFCINSVVLNSMSTEEFLEEKFALSTIYGEDTLYKLHLCTYLSTIDLGNLTILFNISILMDCYNNYKDFFNEK